MSKKTADNCRRDGSFVDVTAMNCRRDGSFVDVTRTFVDVTVTNCRRDGSFVDVTAMNCRLWPLCATVGRGTNQVSYYGLQSKTRWPCGQANITDNITRHET